MTLVALWLPLDLHVGLRKVKLPIHIARSELNTATIHDDNYYA